MALSCRSVYVLKTTFALETNAACACWLTWVASFTFLFFFPLMRSANDELCSLAARVGIFRSTHRLFLCGVVFYVSRWLVGWLVEWLNGWMVGWATVTPFQSLGSGHASEGILSSTSIFQKLWFHEVTKSFTDILREWFYIIHVPSLLSKSYLVYLLFSTTFFFSTEILHFVQISPPSFLIVSIKLFVLYFVWINKNHRFSFLFIYLVITNNEDVPHVLLLDGFLRQPTFADPSLVLTPLYVLLVFHEVYSYLDVVRVSAMYITANGAYYLSVTTISGKKYLLTLVIRPFPLYCHTPDELFQIWPSGDVHDILGFPDK